MIPVIVCLINAIVFFIFMDQTSKHWLTWYGHERTAPYTVDGFAKALAYGNYIYYLEFVLENILFLIVAFVSNIIAKRKSRKKLT